VTGIGALSASTSVTNSVISKCNGIGIHVVRPSSVPHDHRQHGVERVGRWLLDVYSAHTPLQTSDDLGQCGQTVLADDEI
jgi:hypothetical protein